MQQKGASPACSCALAHRDAPLPLPANARQLFLSLLPPPLWCAILRFCTYSAHSELKPATSRDVAVTARGVFSLRTPLSFDSGIGWSIKCTYHCAHNRIPGSRAAPLKPPIAGGGSPGSPREFMRGFPGAGATWARREARPRARADQIRPVRGTWIRTACC